MDAAASVQLFYCGIDPLKRTARRSLSLSSSLMSRAPFRRSSFRISKQNAVVRAIATEPRPTDTKPPINYSSSQSSASPTNFVNGNGSSGTASAKKVNGGSTVCLLYRLNHLFLLSFSKVEKDREAHVNFWKYAFCLICSCSGHK